MKSDFEIGRVVSVETSQVTLELDPDLKALARVTPEGVVEVGQINSYLILPVGAHKIVAMITKVVMREETQLKAEKSLVTLPSARRLVQATMIGNIDDDKFRQGITIFPVLDNPVLLSTKKDLDAIFGTTSCKNDDTDITHSESPQIDIGKSALFMDYPIRINPDVFFGKHVAVLGSTGSGKSCTIAAILQSILSQPEIKHTNIIILDINGEYRHAFQVEKDGEWTDAKPEYRCLYIPTDPRKPKERLTIPYWFLNTDDFVRFFQAARSVQRPILLESLRLARNESRERSFATFIKDELVREFNLVLSLLERTEKMSLSVRSLSMGLIKWLGEENVISGWIRIKEVNQNLDRETIVKAMESIRDEANNYVSRGRGGEEYPDFLPIDVRIKIKNILEPIYRDLTGYDLGSRTVVGRVSSDAPVFFGKDRFRSRHIEQVLRREESGGARARDYSGTMLLRIDRLLEDQRFEFLFGPTGEEWPSPLHSLATFIRDILGLSGGEETLSLESEVQEGVFPFYDRQRSLAGKKPSHNIVIVDLSLLASEVLENVTALIGRLILEFLQHMSEENISGVKRGDFPVVLVLEEAQNYVMESRNSEEESISKQVFERIAREGRKYGLGLVVSSQRPSELSKTVLSQCNSFIVHRLQNPEDLRYFKEIVPGIFKELLDQLLSLAPQYGLVLGECTQAPALVRIRDADPLPSSRNPEFYKHWIDDDPKLPNVEKVCEKWEGSDNSNEPNGNMGN